MANVTGQYSDSISLSATISAGAAFSGTLQFQVDGTIVGAAIPVSRSGVYTTSYLIGKAAGSYNISATFTPSTAGVVGSAGTGTLTVNKEDAVVTPASGNPQSVKVPAPGGAAAPITLTGVVKEATDASHGDISKAVVSVTLVPALAGGASVTCPVTNTGGSLTATCSNVPVEAYTVQWRIAGNYYQGPPVDTTLAVYDPTLGFVTGAGSVMDGSASGDFAFDLQYKGGTLQGALTYLEHRSTGYVSVTTTSLISMSIVGNTAVILGRAVVVALDGSGLHELGTYPVQAIMVDNGEPGVNRDRFGLQLTGVSLNPPVTFAPATITAGNIQMH